MSAADYDERRRKMRQPTTLLDLHCKGWSSGQLADELKTTGVLVFPARMRECLGRWTAGGDGATLLHN
jgi:putative AlgH/UPF0301 family transcriptional regulator